MNDTRPGGLIGDGHHKAAIILELQLKLWWRAAVGTAAQWQVHVVNERGIQPDADAGILHIAPFQGMQARVQGEGVVGPADLTGPLLIQHAIDGEIENIKVCLELTLKSNEPMPAVKLVMRTDELVWLSAMMPTVRHTGPDKPRWSGQTTASWTPARW